MSDLIHPETCTFCGFDGVKMAWAACCTECRDRRLAAFAGVIDAAVASLQAHQLAVYVLHPQAARRCTDIVSAVDDAAWVQVSCALLVKSRHARCRALTLISSAAVTAVVGEAKKRKRQSERATSPPKVRQSVRERATVSYKSLDNNDLAGMVSTLRRQKATVPTAS